VVVGISDAVMAMRRIVSDRAGWMAVVMMAIKAAAIRNLICIVRRQIMRSPESWLDAADHFLKILEWSLRRMA
jgi:hypothetical protein